MLVNARWKAVQNCCVYRSNEFDSNHRPVVATIAKKLRRAITTQSAKRPRYNVGKLADSAVHQQYAGGISDRLAALNKDSVFNWQTFRDAVNNVASTCIGKTRRSYKEWISDTTWNLIERKREARLADRPDAYRSLYKESRASLRKDRQRWADEKAEAGERAWAKESTGGQRKSMDSSRTHSQISGS